MKTSIKKIKSSQLQGIMLLVFCVLWGCAGFSASDFSGTYVNSAGSEFSVADDTLAVEKAKDNRFMIHRSTGFNLLDASGKPGKRQYEKEEWIGVYDAETGIMTEQKKGKQIRFPAGGREMVVESRRYTRIN